MGGNMIMSRAVLDAIDFPEHSPGSLNVRLQLAGYRDDGRWVDDGSRAGPMSQDEKMRIVLPRGVNIRRWMASTAEHLSAMGYEPPDIAMMRHVAQHEWRHDVIAARRARLHAPRPELRLVVRTLGFDIEGRGELAIAIGKATIRGGSATVTSKSHVILQPGDPLPLLFDVLEEVAGRIGYLPLCNEDRRLVEHVARKLWTSETIDGQEARWREADALNGSAAGAVRLIEFAQRLDTLSTFIPVPVGALPAIEQRSVH